MTAATAESSPVRDWLVLAAVLLATVTAAVTALIGATALHVAGAGAYLAIVVAAASTPAGIPAQVIAGQVLAASLLAGRAGPLIVAAVVAVVIVTAELLAIVTRETIPASPRAELRRACAAAAIGATAFALVSVLARIAGPTGLAGIALASAACIILGAQLVRSVR